MTKKELEEKVLRLDDELHRLNVFVVSLSNSVNQSFMNMHNQQVRRNAQQQNSSLLDGSGF